VPGPTYKGRTTRKKVKRKPAASGFANAREAAMYGGSKSDRRQKAAKVERSLRTGRRTSAVDRYRRLGPDRISAREEAIALRTLAREATTPEEWRKLQEESATGFALPELEKGIEARRASDPAKNEGDGGSFVGDALEVLMEVDRFARKVGPGMAAFDLAKNVPSVTNIQAPAALDFSQFGGFENKNKSLQDDIDDASLLVGTGAAAGLARQALKAGARKAAPKVQRVVGEAAEEGVKGSGSGVRGATSRATQGAKGKAKQVAEPVTKSRPAQSAKAATERVKSTRAKVTAATPKPIKTATKAVTWPVRGRNKVWKSAAVLTGANVAGSIPGAVVEGDPLKPLRVVLKPSEGIGTQAVVGAAVALSPTEITDNFFKDLAELPTAIIPSLYLTGDAVVKAVNGNDEELTAMMKDFVENGFLPNVVQGDWEGAREAFERHPLYAALEVSGGYAVVGRGAGAVARSGAAGKKAKSAASTKREDLKIAPGLAAEQRYSKNLITKGFQVLGERKKVRRGEDPFQATPRKAEKELEQQAKTVASGQEGMRRANREEARQVLAKDRRRGDPRTGARWEAPKSLQDIAVFFLDGTVRQADTWREDLSGALARFEAERTQAKVAEKNGESQWTGAQFNENLRNIKDIRKALKNATDADAAKMVEVRTTMREFQDPQMAEIIDRGAYDATQFRTARARPYAVAHMGARWEPRFDNGEGKQRGALVDESGNKISLSQIEARMARDEVDPAFVTQRPGFRGAKGNFYQAASFVKGRRGSIPKAKRTGRASEAGLFDASLESAVEQLISSTTLLDRLKGMDKMFAWAAIRESGADGAPAIKFENRMKADDAIKSPEDFGLPTNIPLKAVRITPVGSTAGERQAAQRFLDDEAKQTDNPNISQPSEDVRALERLDQELLRKTTDDGPGEWIVVPEKVFDVVEALAAPQNTIGKVVASYANLFKGVILPVSLRWLLGNVVDPNLRSAIAGLTPLDWVVGQRLLAELRKYDPDEAKRVETVLVGGTQYGTAGRLEIRRTSPDQWGESQVLTNLLRGWLALRTAPGAKQIGDTYARYREFMFRNNSRWFERQPQIAALGKEARQRLRDVDASWRDGLKAGGGAYTDLARGLTNTKTQVAYAQAIERVFGKWNRLGRLEKDVLGYYVPFGLWIRAAYSFVAVTLPRHHPIKAAIGSVIEQMTEEDRIALGLSMFGDERVPDYHLGSIPISEDFYFRPQYMTSFGMFSDPFAQLSRSVLPQIDGVFAAFEGLDWRGEELVSRSGEPLGQEEKLGLALINLATTSMPLLSLGLRILGNDATGLIARTPYPADPEPLSKRLETFLGLSYLDREGIENAKKYRRSYSIRVPGVPGGSGSSTTRVRRRPTAPAGSNYVPGRTNVKGF